MFRKPKKNIRSQRRVYKSDEEEENLDSVASNNRPKDYDSNGSSTIRNNDNLDDDSINLKEIQSNISKYKESKLNKKKKAEKFTDKSSTNTKNSNKGSTLSFEQDLEGGKYYS